MQIGDVIPEFLAYLRVERSCSPLTLESYRWEIDHLVGYLCASGLPLSVGDVRTPVLRRYVLEMQAAHGYAPRTVARKVATLRSFFSYCEKQEYTAGNPAGALTMPNPPKGIPTYLTAQELSLLFAVAERAKGCVARTHEAMVKTLAWTGMRREELCRLRWEDIDFGQRTITVRRGKGSKDRVIPMHERLEKHLWGFLQSRLPLSSPYVFVSTHGGPYDAQSVYRIVRGLLVRAGIAKSKMGPHVLRHTFATLLLQTGRVDLVTLQRLLGHGHLQTVLVYAHADAGSMQAAVSFFPVHPDTGGATLENICPGPSCEGDDRRV